MRSPFNALQVKQKLATTSRSLWAKAFLDLRNHSWDSLWFHLNILGQNMVLEFAEENVERVATPNGQGLKSPVADAYDGHCRRLRDNQPIFKNPFTGAMDQLTDGNVVQHIGDEAYLTYDAMCGYLGAVWAVFLTNCTNYSYVSPQELEILDYALKCKAFSKVLNSLIPVITPAELAKMRGNYNYRLMLAQLPGLEAAQQAQILVALNKPYQLTPAQVECLVRVIGDRLALNHEEKQVLLEYLPTIPVTLSDAQLIDLFEHRRLELSVKQISGLLQAVATLKHSGFEFNHERQALVTASAPYRLEIDAEYEAILARYGLGLSNKPIFLTLKKLDESLNMPMSYQLTSAQIGQLIQELAGVLKLGSIEKRALAELLPELTIDLNSQQLINILDNKVLELSHNQIFELIETAAARSKRQFEFDNLRRISFKSYSYCQLAVDEIKHEATMVQYRLTTQTKKMFIAVKKTDAKRELITNRLGKFIERNELVSLEELRHASTVRLTEVMGHLTARQQALWFQWKKDILERKLQRISRSIERLKDEHLIADRSKFIAELTALTSDSELATHTGVFSNIYSLFRTHATTTQREVTKIRDCMQHADENFREELISTILTA